MGFLPNEGYADPSPLSFVPIFMIDAHSAESNEKNIFSDFYF